MDRFAALRADIDREVQNLECLTLSLIPFDLNQEVEHDIKGDESLRCGFQRR